MRVLMLSPLVKSTDWAQHWPKPGSSTVGKQWVIEVISVPAPAEITGMQEQGAHGHTQAHTWWNFHNNPISMGFRELWGWWTHPRAAGVVRPKSMGTEAPVCRTFLNLMCVSLHLILHSYHLISLMVSSNLVGKLFSWILWATVANNQTQLEGCGNLWFTTSRSETQIGIWTFNWHLKWWW